jgi:hypothetical protein
MVQRYDLGRFLDLSIVERVSLTENTQSLCGSHTKVLDCASV